MIAHQNQRTLAAAGLGLAARLVRTQSVSIQSYRVSGLRTLLWCVLAIVLVWSARLFLFGVAAVRGAYICAMFACGVARGLAAYILYILYIAYVVIKNSVNNILTDTNHQTH